MIQSDFISARDAFRFEYIKKERDSLYKDLKIFQKTFDILRIESLKLDEYAQGHGDKDNFCYQVERKFSVLGHITGSTAQKFGVYYSKEKGQYIFVKKWGDSLNEAFKNIKQEIISLIKSGEQNNLHEIAENRISNMLKGKILSLYFPERYLNIFSNDHLIYYLKFFNLDSPEIIKSDPVFKREALLDFKKSDPVMRSWSLDQFATFLYSEYPKAPFKEQLKSSHEDYLESYFVNDISMANLSYVQNLQKKSNLNVFCLNEKKKDYEKEQRKNKELGDRGEKIVMDFETNRLKKISIRKKPRRISLDSDSVGYDILSYNKDGSERYIEVKATSGGIGKSSFFYTINEYETALRLKENYHIYMVYNVKSSKPIIFDMENPFIIKNSLSLKPILFKVDFNTMK